MLAGCLIMTLFGCKDDKPKLGAPMNVRVFGVMGRADLNPGLKMGLFIGEPVNAENIPMTVSNDGFAVPDKDVNWMFDQSQSSRFFVYAPFDGSFSGQETVIIKTPTDQRSEEWMLKGNVLMGMVSGGPKDSYVNIKLKHAMTAMNVIFDNRTSDKIEALTVSGVMTMGELDLLTGTLTAIDSLGVITPLRARYNEDSFSFIYIPQNLTPLLTVTMSSGKTYSFTYDNYCHEYPGSIIKMQIQIDESTPKIKILQLSGVNISQWVTNGVPTFAQVPTYINLSGLKDVEPDEDEDGFFSAYLNKVTVTAVDRTAEDILGVILEDTTCAIHVWTYYDSPLKVGNTIVGPVLGLMDKPSEDEFHISNFYTSYATIGKPGELPCTEGTFKELPANIGKWEYRRMLFKDVMLVSEFKNDRAVFIQDSVRVSVVCPGLDLSLAVGVKGDLIGFPVRQGSDIMVMVYDPTQFRTFSKETADNVLTRNSVYGMYDLSMPDTAIHYLNGPDAQLQYSTRLFDYGRTMQVTDTRNGEANLFLIYADIGVPVAGHEYIIVFNAMGNTKRKGTTVTMECVKVDENSAWFIDWDNKRGLIMAL